MGRPLTRGLPTRWARSPKSWECDDATFEISGRGCELLRQPRSYRFFLPNQAYVRSTPRDACPSLKCSTRHSHDLPRPRTMLKPTFSSLLPKRLGAGWTCAQCRSQFPRPSFPRTPLSRQYGSTGPSFTTPKPKPRRRTAVLLATAGGGAAAMLLSVSDDVKNSYGALERTGRVASTLVLCINE